MQVMLSTNLGRARPAIKTGARARPMSSLSPYATDAGASRGRRYAEGPAKHRSTFERDRDRILHSQAFRRLKHKTQVFVEHEGDHFRTRLTHTLEVAQVARSISAALGLDLALAEAIALAHDLGHPPFGHTGEDALAEVMAAYGGFDHNAQALKIVTRLEVKYAEFDGLNLTWETLEGIAKHNGPVTGTLPFALAEYNANHDLELSSHAGLEAQVAALADDIAYNNHDLDDGLRAGLFTLDDLSALPIVGACLAEVDARYPGLERPRRQYETLRRVFGAMVEDVLRASQAELAQCNPQSVEEVRAMGRTAIVFSPQMLEQIAVIRAFLFEHMYRAPSVVEMREKTANVVRQLFAHFMARPEQMPEVWNADIPADDQARARLVADYIAGMTDRYAFRALEQAQAR